MKRYIRSSDSSEKIIYEDDDIITIAQSNGTATYDKNNGLLLSWEGNADRTHVYKYTLDGQTQFVELTDEQRDAFEDKYNVHLSYWRD